MQQLYIPVRKPLMERVLLDLAKTCSDKVQEQITLVINDKLSNRQTVCIYI